MKSTLAQLAATSPDADGAVEFCLETRRWYFYIADSTTLTGSGAALPVATNRVTVTGNGGNSRWVDIQYRAIGRVWRSGDQGSITTETKLLLNATSFDSHLIFDASNNQFVVKKTGRYRVTAQARWDSTSAATTFALSIYANSVAVGRNTTPKSGATYHQVEDIVELAAGQNCYLTVTASGGGIIEGDNNSRTYMTIEEMT